MVRYIFTVLLSISFVFAYANTDKLEAKIMKAFPGAEIEKRAVKYHYTAEYTIMIDQWIDHNDHSKGTFKQRLFLSHIDKKAPMLMVTEGYGARPRFYELSKMLMSNQLIVEYRNFGKSVPEKIDYKYHTNEQAMEDLHRINKAFKKYYCKEWVSTGISKGGTTCLYYKATFPKDVKVAVPYVAPVPDAREDIRCDELIASIGDDDCRAKLTDFQITALKYAEDMLPLAQEAATKNKLTFNRIEGVEKAIEYAILEYTFSFWQMGHSCNDIPTDPTAQETFDHIMKIVGIDFYSDGVIAFYEPAFYQFMTQNGYYGFMNKHLSDYLHHVTVFDNSIFGPRDVSLDYDPNYNITINQKLAKAKKMLIIQGENDPWGALSYVPAAGQKSLLMVKKAGSHQTRIKDFDGAELEKIYSFLDAHLKAEIHKL